VLVGLAQDLGLESAAFATCLSGREALERVLSDSYDASGVATETPTFVIVYAGQGRRLEGARTGEEFVKLLETQVEAALSVESGSGG
jgi:predicted DsbA family dithiol-disulfide isomerase